MTGQRNYLSRNEKPFCITCVYHQIPVEYITFLFKSKKPNIILTFPDLLLKNMSSAFKTKQPIKKGQLINLHCYLKLRSPENRSKRVTINLVYNV